MLTVVVSLGFVAALAGCSTPSNTPEAYDATVEDNFINGCTATAPASSGDSNDSQTTSTLGQGADPGYCQCAYNWFVNNVPYNNDATTTTAGNATTTENPASFTFEDINADLADDPASMPPVVANALTEACGTSDKPGTPETTTPTTAGAEEDPDNSSTTTSTPG